MPIVEISIRCRAAILFSGIIHNESATSQSSITGSFNTPFCKGME